MSAVCADGQRRHVKGSDGDPSVGSGHSPLLLFGGLGVVWVFGRLGVADSVRGVTARSHYTALLLAHVDPFVGAGDVVEFVGREFHRAVVVAARGVDGVEFAQTAVKVDAHTTYDSEKGTLSTIR